MLDISVLKFEKSTAYLNNQLKCQEDNKQLILDIITNIGLISSTAADNEQEHYKNLLKSANTFLQKISNNIIYIGQLNLEMKNIINELTNIINEKNNNSRSKEFYIASFSNVKNNITQYTQKFQKVAAQLEKDNAEFNNFISENNFKYNFTSNDSLDDYNYSGFSLEDVTKDLEQNENIEETVEEIENVENLTPTEPITENLGENNLVETIQGETEEPEEPSISNTKIDYSSIYSNVLENANPSIEQNISDEYGFFEVNNNVSSNDVEEPVQINEVLEVEENNDIEETTQIKETLDIEENNDTEETIQKNETLEVEKNNDIEEAAQTTESLETVETNDIEENTQTTETLEAEENNDFEIRIAEEILENAIKGFADKAELENIIEEAEQNSETPLEENTSVEETVQDLETAKPTVEESTSAEENVEDLETTEPTVEKSTSVEETVQDLETTEPVVEESASSEENVEDESNDDLVYSEALDDLIAEEILKSCNKPSTDTDAIKKIFRNNKKETENSNDTSKKSNKNFSLQSSIELSDEELSEKIKSIYEANSDNDTLIISESQNKIFLPYTINEAESYAMNCTDLYTSAKDVINKKFILPLYIFSENSRKEKIHAIYNLLRKHDKKSKIKSALSALVISRKKNLNPAIILSCKNGQDLYNYIHCLKTNTLNEFDAFKIVYKINLL